MTEVDQFISALPRPDSAVLQPLVLAAKQEIPAVEQGMSYAMPALFYRKQAVLSFAVRKRHYSLYPFSGKVLVRLADLLEGFETTSGSVHFTVDHPVSEALVVAIVRARMEEINFKLDGLPRP